MSQPQAEPAEVAGAGVRTERRGWRRIARLETNRFISGLCPTGQWSTVVAFLFERDHLHFNRTNTSKLTCNFTHRDPAQSHVAHETEVHSTTQVAH